MSDYVKSTTPAKRVWFEVVLGYFMIFDHLDGWCEDCQKIRSSRTLIAWKYLEKREIWDGTCDKRLTILSYALHESNRIAIKDVNTVMNGLLSNSQFHSTEFSIWALKVLNKLLRFASTSNLGHKTFGQNIFMFVMGKQEGWKLLLPNLTCGYRTVGLK
jgi:hypothetical protein